MPPFSNGGSLKILKTIPSRIGLAYKKYTDKIERIKAENIMQWFSSIIRIFKNHDKLRNSELVKI